jgi:hypothetical protein
MERETGSAGQQLGQTRCQASLFASQLEQLGARGVASDQVHIGPAKAECPGDRFQDALGGGAVNSSLGHKHDQDRILVGRHLAILPADPGSGSSGLYPHADSHLPIVSRPAPRVGTLAVTGWLPC